MFDILCVSLVLWPLAGFAVTDIFQLGSVLPISDMSERSDAVSD